MVCTSHDVNEIDSMEARSELWRWGQMHKVPPKTVKAQIIRQALWYQCNCKWWYSDPVAEDELRCAQDLVFSRRGQFRSGHIWSKRWEKMYAILPLKAMIHILRPSDLCPESCAYDIVF
ncbi:hypothetical protein GGS26DRAFT_590559 [Hypomontagnella submonticulosa]|nr:hypothetical protein GGS26DRAFT_590559 [Hypomontagnella submonticulosa]